jgi:2-succinyl-6-hydroxy-2,4-cyclohexadiene-1-carboxylate synthase
MEISSNGIIINVICESDFIPKHKTAIIFLHGFTGSGNDWHFLTENLNPNYFPIAIDLPGHGKTKAPNDLRFYSTEAYANVINVVLDYFKIDKTIILGYSMGGRTALSFAAKYPQKVISLVLESSTAGIDEEAERVSRIKTDTEIADSILTNGINPFVDYWMNLPFFLSLKSLDDNEYSKLIERKKQNSAIGLANSLKGFSTGRMSSVWNELPKFNFPTLLIAGSLDRKYVRINKMMNNKIKNSVLKIIQDCGHNTHLENKQEFTILVNNFLNSLK